jgi:cell division protein FtsI/penicillin-binding protein 2
MVEYGGEGSQVAVPVAREIFSWYAEHQADF